MIGLQDTIVRKVFFEIETSRLHELRRCEFPLNRHELLYNRESVIHWPFLPVFPMISERLTASLLLEDVFGPNWVVLISTPQCGSYR